MLKANFLSHRKHSPCPLQKPNSCWCLEKSLFIVGVRRNNAISGENAAFVSVASGGGTCSNHWTLNVLKFRENVCMKSRLPCLSFTVFHTYVVWTRRTHDFEKSGTTKRAIWWLVRNLSTRFFESQDYMNGVVNNDGSLFILCIFGSLYAILSALNELPSFQNINTPVFLWKLYFASISFFLCVISTIFLKWTHLKSWHWYSSARFNKDGFKYRQTQLTYYIRYCDNLFRPNSVIFRPLI
jgi:hypothetical protein